MSKPTRDPIAQDPESHHRSYGWKTGNQAGITKAIQLQYLHMLIRDRKFTIHDPEAWSQYRTMVRLPSGRIEAERGYHDDIPMAHSIIATVCQLHPCAQPESSKKDEAPFLSEKWVRNRIAKKKAAKSASGGGYY